VPADLLRRVHKVILNVLPPPAAPSPTSALSKDCENLELHVATLQAGDDRRRRNHALQAAERASRSASSSPTRLSSGSEISESKNDDRYDFPWPMPKPATMVGRMRCGAPCVRAGGGGSGPGVDGLGHGRGTAAQLQPDAPAPHLKHDGLPAEGDDVCTRGRGRQRPCVGAEGVPGCS